MSDYEVASSTKPLAIHVAQNQRYTKEDENEEQN
jgi:hypothetical protein